MEDGYVCASSLTYQPSPIHFSTMNVKIALFEKGLVATYNVVRVDNITFNARLKAYSGSKPPSYIKFYKTELGWGSAFEDADLIGELGSAVDAVAVG
jgi:hypothetical protein